MAQGSITTRTGLMVAGLLAGLTVGAAAPAYAATAGANQDCGAFCPAYVGDLSGNGHGPQAVKRPAAGTVGNADAKNPPGQSAADHNRGYECDTNSGVGRTNPAHSGCDLGGPSAT